MAAHHSKFVLVVVDVIFKQDRTPRRRRRVEVNCWGVISVSSNGDAVTGLDVQGAVGSRYGTPCGGEKRKREPPLSDMPRSYSLRMYNCN